VEWVWSRVEFCYPATDNMEQSAAINAIIGRDVARLQASAEDTPLPVLNTTVAVWTVYRVYGTIYKNLAELNGTLNPHGNISDLPPDNS